MSLILEKHFVFLEYFPASLKVLEQLLNPKQKDVQLLNYSFLNIYYM